MVDPNVRALWPRRRHAARFGAPVIHVGPGLKPAGSFPLFQPGAAKNRMSPPAAQGLAYP